MSAPSGAGKSTLIAKIRQMFPDILYSVSCTTRSPRTGETDGVEYHFLDHETFEAMTAADEFLEWKEVHGNRYGTPRLPVLRALAENRRMILDIDVQGAAEVFKRLPQSVGIFILAPSLEVLEQRLRKRGTDSEEVIRRRLAAAAGEIHFADMFQHKIVNDDLGTAVESLAEIMRRAGASCAKDQETPQAG